MDMTSSSGFFVRMSGAALILFLGLAVVGEGADLCPSIDQGGPCQTSGDVGTCGDIAVQEYCTGYPMPYDYPAQAVDCPDSGPPYTWRCPGLYVHCWAYNCETANPPTETKKCVATTNSVRGKITYGACGAGVGNCNITPSTLAGSLFTGPGRETVSCDPEE